MDSVDFWRKFWSGFCKEEAGSERLWVVADKQRAPIIHKISSVESCIGFKFEGLATAFLTLLELGGVGSDLQLLELKNKGELSEFNVPLTLEELLERAVKGPPMTEEEIREQRASWVRGEKGMDRDGETRLTK